MYNERKKDKTLNDSNVQTWSFKIKLE